MKKLLLILIMLHLPMARAGVDVNLYSGEAVVSSQAEADRNDAVPEALIQVLQKLSGQREISSSQVLDDALANAGRLLRSYGYRTVDRIGPDGVTVPELRLVAQFIQQDVDRIVQQAKLPRWRQERPVVEIWVVIDDGRNRVLKPLEFGYTWNFVEDMAAMRGLPVRWPELGEEEEQLLDMRLIWGGFTDYLLERGVPADGVVIITARREGPQWNLRWNLAIGEQRWSWNNSDMELMYALAQGVHHMTDQIAAGSTIQASDQALWIAEVSIGELNSAADYVNCLDYLQNMSFVTSVEIMAAEPGSVHFRLQLNAPLEHLTQAFNRGSVLVPSSAGSAYEYEFLR